MWGGLLVGLLIIVPGLCQSTTADCIYNDRLINGETYYVFNPDYPNITIGKQSCEWTVKSDYRIKLTCDEFSIPRSVDCLKDYLSVQSGRNTKKRYCGVGGFSIESEADEMNITFSSSYWSKGGKFLCLLQAIENFQENNNCHCGWKNPDRIIGGTETGVNEYPMMTGLVDFKARLIICGGTIISPKYVISAAHCFTNRNKNELGVIVGEHNIKTGSETNATKLFRLLKYVIHPEYNEAIGTNDISIMTVSTPIEFTALVGPVCLPFQHQPDTFGGDFVTMLGWGTRVFGNEKSDVLQKVMVSVITYNKCKRTYQDVTTKQMCTYTSGKDACQFDSGGPVLWQNPTTRNLILVGIISYGGICGDTPAVNTRVGAYINWIVSQTPGALLCMQE